MSDNDFGCPDGDARLSYYDITSYPTCIFNGTDFVVGAGADAADGSTYEPVVLSMLDDATPVKMRITDYAFGFPAYVSVEVELTDDIEDITGTYVRFMILENELWDSPRWYQDILRDVLVEEPLTISQAGQIQTVYRPIDMGAFTYENVDNLWIASIVQRDSDRYILQSCNSYPIPDYSFRFYALGDRVLIDSGTVTFDDFSLFNTGVLTDSYELSLDTSDLPAGWQASIYDGDSYHSSVTVGLAPGESATYWIVMETHPDNPGGGTATLNIHSQGNRTDDRSLGYTVITADTQILLVDDDGAEEFETLYFAPALETTARSFAIWDRNAAGLTADILGNFDAVVWNCGWAFPTVTDEDRDALADYLDNGGALFITGQDIGWELNTQGGPDAVQWYRNYLGANYVGDDTNAYNLNGVDNDPISDGISIVIQGGDGADNQQYPSDIDPFGADAYTIFTYDAYRNGAVRKDTGFRSVYFAFGYEAINNAEDRELVMQRIIDYLIPDLTGTDDNLPVMPLALRQNVPNPFNPATEISFSLNQSGEIRLTVFDVEGRRIAVLAEGMHSAGRHNVTWNGRDDAGREVASGLYFYRLEGADEVLTRKMLLLK